MCLHLVLHLTANRCKQELQDQLTIMFKFLLSVVIRAQIIFHNLKSVDIVKKNVREISLQRIAFSEF